MRTLITTCAFAALFTVLASAETWTGRLVDANCVLQTRSANGCDPSGSTSAFALIVSNRAYRLDDAGNAKAADAIKGRADRSADPNKPPSPQVAARVTGSMDENNTIKVEAIEVQ